MVEGYIKIGEKNLPFRRSLNAMKAFDERFKDEGMTIFKMGDFGNKMRTEHVIAMLYLFIRAGLKAEATAMPEFTEEWIGDNITMTQMNSIIAGINGGDVPDDNGPEPVKKNYKGGE